VPNYFADAWHARRFVDEQAHKALPRDDISLAINSVYGRSQNQLHIHIDCVRADVRDALRQREHDIRDEWSALDVKLGGHTYLARRLVTSDLTSVNPFQLLADGVPRAAHDMGAEILVVVGAAFSDGQDGFYLLSDHADGAPGDRGNGEELQDHSCAVATTAR
jgi:CDP-diacylglycerol pyrophosphatase